MRLSSEQLATIAAWQALSEEDRTKPLKWITFTSSKDAKEAARNLMQAFAVASTPCARCGDTGFTGYSCNAPSCPVKECSVGPCPDCKDEK